MNYDVVEIGELKKAHIGIRVNIEEKERCLQECKRRNITISQFLRDCIECYFENMEK